MESLRCQPVLAGLDLSYSVFIEDETRLCMSAKTDLFRSNNFDQQITRRRTTIFETFCDEYERTRKARQNEATEAKEYLDIWSPVQVLDRIA